MKNAIIIAVALAVGFGAGWFSKPIPTVEREELPQGGAEVAIPEPEPVRVGEYVFPIAPEDFLMKTSPFGLRVSPLVHVEMKHQGLDIAGVWRCQIVAIADGVVVEHWPPPGTRGRDGRVFKGNDIYGGMVRIDHGEGVESLYAHMSTTRVYEGQKVEAGQVIGRQGATGKAAGAHLHLEIIVDGEPVNPALYLPDIGAGR